MSNRMVDFVFICVIMLIEITKEVEGCITFLASKKDKQCAKGSLRLLRESY